MAGTVRYKTDVYISDAASLNVAQGVFKTVWDAFQWGVTNGICSEISRNNGNDSTYANAVGTDFWDGANPFGQGAWAIFLFPAVGARTTPLYIRIAWSHGSGIFDNLPNTDAKILSSVGTQGLSLGLQMAWAFDNLAGAANPVPAVSSGSLGSDAIASPLWDTPAGGSLHMLPMSNNPGNSHDTLKNNHVGVRSTTLYTSARVHVWMDSDTIGIEVNLGDAVNLTTAVYMGAYTPLTGLTLSTPLFMMASNGVEIIKRNVVMSTAAGNASNEGGLATNREDPIGVLRLQYSDDLLNATSPAAHLDVPAFLLHQIPLCRDIAEQVGWLPPALMRLTRNRANRDLSEAGAMKVSSESIDNNRAKLITTWDLSNPGTGFTRSGNQS